MALSSLGSLHLMKNVYFGVESSHENLFISFLIQQIVEKFKIANIICRHSLYYDFDMLFDKIGKKNLMKSPSLTSGEIF